MYFRDQIIDYICTGRVTGGFMFALMSGNLYKAVQKADDTNRLQIVQLVEWIYNHAPIGCYGSEERVHAWVDKRGLTGKGGDEAITRWKVSNDIEV